MSNDGAGDDKDRSVAKTAGFVVFSGIAMSILKALNPLNKPNLHNNNEAEPISESTRTSQDPHSLSPQEPIIKRPITTSVEQNVPSSESTRTAQQQHSVSLQEPIIKKPVTSVEQNLSESSLRMVQIVRGDTLWGLSRKYGVTIEAIKQANGLTGDTIYAGKKLVIP